MNTVPSKDGQVTGKVQVLFANGMHRQIDEQKYARDHLIQGQHENDVLFSVTFLQQDKSLYATWRYCRV